MKKAALFLLPLCALALLLSALLFAGAENGPNTADAFSAAAPEETPAPESPEEQARRLLAAMSREEKVWQMLVVFPQDLTGQASVADLETWADAMQRRPVGGVVLDGSNLLSVDAVRAMTAAIRNAADIPVFLCVDEEGGQVARLAYSLHAVTDFQPMFCYRDGGPETAYANAFTIGSEIRDFGFNVNFAPVADVWTNPENTVIGRRAYSDDPAEAAELVAAAVRGFTDAGVIATLKHFPGHGDTAEDSHTSAAVCGKNLDELMSCEFLPFLSGMEAGAGLVMVGHITLTEIDPDAPATLSEAVVTGLLRGKLGYRGVVITDSMQMEALSGCAEDEGTLAVMAVNAGCDLLLGPHDPDAVAAALMEQVPEARLDESVLRILTLKIENGIIQK
ncbi:MAG: glycoside hydrolase family 3 protein [Oscillospiraceae bacterium]